MSKPTIQQSIIAMEKKALDLWGQGDPSGCLAISSENVTYFDPYLKNRINGLAELTAYYNNLRGKIFIDRYELINPEVVVNNRTAILTYNYVSYNNQGEHRWNCTEVYQQFYSTWKIIHTHWSLTEQGSK